MNRKEAFQKISELKKEAIGKIDEAKKFADQFGISFNFDLAYGMGGTYYPPSSKRTDDWSASSQFYESGWVSSTSNCS